ncbi:MAG: ECF-type sigma factor [Bryobacteraceae bacterium]
MQRAFDTSDRVVPEYMPVVYDELRRLASQFLRRENGNHSLQPTALVHEAYIELSAWKDFQFQSRAQFFGAAAFAMRRVLAAAGRRRRSLKRGAIPLLVSLEDIQIQTHDPLFDVVAVDIALSRLEAISPEASQVLEVRLFGGLTIEETAAFLGISTATVKRHWIAARAWLSRELAGIR